jgi:hypothetical protein
MTKTAKNSRAFPRPNTANEAGWSQLGMSLRDYFAGQALIGILANQYRMDGDDQITNHAFILADKMLERSQNEKT